MDVALQVVHERQRQDAKWGPQNHPWIRVDPESAVRTYFTGVTSADTAKAMCDQADAIDHQSFARILIEEVAEALEAPTMIEVRQELIQVAAVCVAAVEAMDRATAYPQRWIYLR